MAWNALFRRLPVIGSMRRSAIASQRRPPRLDRRRVYRISYRGWRRIRPASQRWQEACTSHCASLRDAVADALEFAGWAPDGDSVAAVVGTLLGAVHGVEALPVEVVNRLELGWVMDTLARDLALQVTTNQAGSGWKGDGYEDPLNPYWDVRYPGV